VRLRRLRRRHRLFHPFEGELLHALSFERVRYAVNGKRYMVMVGGNAVLAFALL